MESFPEQCDTVNASTSRMGNGTLSPIEGYNPWSKSEAGPDALNGIEYVTKILQSDFDPVIRELIENKDTLDKALDSLSDSRGTVRWEELELEFNMEGPPNTEVSDVPFAQAIPEHIQFNAIPTQSSSETQSAQLPALSVEVPDLGHSKYAVDGGVSFHQGTSTDGKVRMGRPPTPLQRKRRMYDTTRSAVGTLVIFIREISGTVGTFQNLFLGIYQYLQFICACPNLRVFLQQNEEYVTEQIPVPPGEPLDYSDLWKANKLYLRAVTCLRKESGRSWTHSVNIRNGSSWLAQKRHLEVEVGQLWEQALTHMRHSDPSFYWDHGPGSNGLIRVLPKQL